jgi:anti-sigma factor RsiW
VTAVGGFDPVAWQSTGIGCAVEISSDVPADQLARLQEAVGQAAGIPGAIRAGVTVYRTS